MDPGLTVEIVADPEPEDLFGDRCDVVYLPYRPHHSEMFCWQVGAMVNVPVASAAYVERHGMPTSPEAMARHDIIRRSGPQYPVTDRLERNGQSAPLVCRSIAYAGDVPTSMAALMSGDGIALDLAFALCESSIEAGLVVPVLGGWHRPEWQIHMACTKSSLGNTRLVNFIRWIIVAERKAMKARRSKAEAVLQSLASEQ